MNLLIKFFITAMIIAPIPFAMIKLYADIEIKNLHFVFIGLLVLVKLAADKMYTTSSIEKHVSYQLSKDARVKKVSFIKNGKDVALIICALIIFITQILT